MGDAQPISERVNRWQRLFESLPFLSDNMTAKGAAVCRQRSFVEDNMRIYGVKDSYIKYLSQYQEHLFLHESGSSRRKYIGVVFEINKFSYFAPLSSFKSKHKKMKEGVDFIRIKDYAVININNMIPVPKRQLVELNIKEEKDPHYKFLLQAESREINKQKTGSEKMRR